VKLAGACHISLHSLYQWLITDAFRICTWLITDAFRNSDNQLSDIPLCTIGIGNGQKTN